MYTNLRWSFRNGIQQTYHGHTCAMHKHTHTIPTMKWNYTIKCYKYYCYHEIEIVSLCLFWSRTATGLAEREKISKNFAYARKHFNAK